MASGKQVTLDLGESRARRQHPLTASQAVFSRQTCQLHLSRALDDQGYSTISNLSPGPLTNCIVLLFFEKEVAAVKNPPKKYSSQPAHGPAM